MPIETNPSHAYDCKCFKWKPVFVGALTAIGLSFLLNLFSAAIGLTAFTTDSQGIEALAMGGLIATALGIVASMFASGWLAGYLGNRYCTRGNLGALYGFLAWCIALIITIFLAAHVAKYLTFYTHFISGTSDQALSVANTADEIKTNVVATGKNVVISAYTVFVLFFLGAIAATLGGHSGMRHAYKKEMNPR